jgi:hypothetical protein
MQTDQSRYLDALLKLYLGLPETPSQASSPDIRLACNLYQRRITLETVGAALLLASVAFSKHSCHQGQNPHKVRL